MYLPQRELLEIPRGELGGGEGGGEEFSRLIFSEVTKGEGGRGGLKTQKQYYWNNTIASDKSGHSSPHKVLHNMN